MAANLKLSKHDFVPEICVKISVKMDPSTFSKLPQPHKSKYKHIFSVILK